MESDGYRNECWAQGRREWVPQAASAYQGGGMYVYAMYEGHDFWDSQGVYSAQAPYATTRVPAAAQQAPYSQKGGYRKGGYSSGKGKYQGGQALRERRIQGKRKRRRRRGLWYPRVWCIWRMLQM